MYVLYLYRVCPKGMALCASNSPPMKGRGGGGVCNFLFFRKITPHPNPSPRVGRGVPFGSRRSFLKSFLIFDTPSVKHKFFMEFMVEDVMYQVSTM